MCAARRFNSNDMKHCQIYWKIQSNLLTHSHASNLSRILHFTVENINPELVFHSVCLSYDAYPMLMNFRWNKHHNWQTNIFTVKFAQTMYTLPVTHRMLTLTIKCQLQAFIQMHNRKVRTLIFRWQVNWQPQNMAVFVVISIVNVQRSLSTLWVAFLFTLITFRFGNFRKRYAERYRMAVRPARECFN